MFKGTSVIFRKTTTTCSFFRLTARKSLCKVETYGFLPCKHITAQELVRLVFLSSKQLAHTYHPLYHTIWVHVAYIAISETRGTCKNVTFLYKHSKYTSATNVYILLLWVLFSDGYSLCFYVKVVFINIRVISYHYSNIRMHTLIHSFRYFVSKILQLIKKCFDACLTCSNNASLG